MLVPDIGPPAFRPQILLLLFFFYEFLLIYCAESCVPVSEDANILSQIKSTVSDPSDHLSSWAPPRNSCTAASPAHAAYNSSSCAYESSQSNRLPWQGVSCGRLHGRVTALNLSGMSLAGLIPGAAIGRLKFLRVLDLSYNNFRGSFPVDLANCTHLQALELSKNAELEGSIPREWGRLSGLQELVVRRTGLSGSIPTELTNCSELEFLVLRENQLSGRIPAEMGALGKLHRLVLGTNPGLTGTIPATLANCSVLTVLNMPGCGLSGSIPALLGTLPILKDLTFSDNLLTGDIPAILANCSLLTFLHLANNELSGHIPPELGSLTRLTRLNLRGPSYLKGELPATLGNCSALQRMTISESRISGSLPSELGLLSLVHLNLGHNNLTGEVPSAMFSSRTNMLKRLDLSHNQLSGSFQFLNQPKLKLLPLLPEVGEESLQQPNP